MHPHPSTRLASELRARMHHLGITQQALASMLGRPQPRVSELLRSLDSGKLAKDRLALLLEVCDALHLTLLPVPVDKLERVTKLLGSPPDRPAGAAPLPALFDELFVDLSDGAEQEEDRHHPDEPA